MEISGVTLLYLKKTANGGKNCRQGKVNNEVLEAALKALLKSNSAGFDILSVCFYELKEQDEYRAIAVKVFKDYWNELYNLAIADTAFERDISFSSLEKTYDFWNENK